jgi:predicted metal-dependent hydrolase
MSLSDAERRTKVMGNEAHHENQDIFSEARKEIFDQTKDIPTLTNLQLQERFSYLTGNPPPSTTRDWMIEAVVRLIQSQYYKEKGIEIPITVKENNDRFFAINAPDPNKKKTPKSKRAINRETLNKDRIRLLHSAAKTCAKYIPDSSIKFHPENKYATVKSGKSVVMYIERKLRKIIVHMGGERDRKASPKINIFVSTEKEEFEKDLREFISDHLENYIDRRNKRWAKCEDVLAKLVDEFRNKISECNEVHAHPSGRYTTFKKGRLVLVFITQDRAKGEIAFHPGGEREGRPEITTVLKMKNIKKDEDIYNAVDNFLKTIYADYMSKRNKNVKQNKEEMAKLLVICSGAIPSNKTFQHPKDFFGLVKQDERTLLMIKRTKNVGEYEIVAWVKKQKNNPSTKISISWTKESIQEAIKDLYRRHLE